MVRDRDLAAGIGRLDPLAVVQVVLGVDPVEEQHPGLRRLVGVAHDRRPELARPDRGIDPEPVLAAGARRPRSAPPPARPCATSSKVAVRLDRPHQRVGDAHRDVEVVELARLPLGADELHDVGMVAAQHPHLRPAPRAGALHRGAGLVEDVHVADRPRGRAVGAAAPAPRAAGSPRSRSRRRRPAAWSPPPRAARCRCRACRPPSRRPNRPPVARSS